MYSVGGSQNRRKKFLTNWRRGQPEISLKKESQLRGNDPAARWLKKAKKLSKRFGK